MITSRSHSRRLRNAISARAYGPLDRRQKNGSGSTGNRLSVLLGTLAMSSGESLNRGAYVVCTALALRIGRRRFGARLGGRLFFIASTGTRGRKSRKGPEGSRLHSEKYSIFASFRQLLRGMPCLNRPSFPEERPTHHGQLLVAFAGELVLVAVAVLTPLIYLQALPRAQLTNAIFLAPPPPPPPPPRQASVPRIAKVIPRRFVVGHLTAPVTVPKQVASLEEQDFAPPSEATGIVGGVPGGVSGGQIGGVIGGIIGSTPSAAPPPVLIFRRRRRRGYVDGFCLGSWGS
jgi:hypothetical protein